MIKNTDIEKDGIVRSLNKGDIHAFNYLFEKYSKVLYHFSYSILKSGTDAEELVQDVFLKIWEKRNKIDPMQSFRAYLFTVALNHIRRLFLNKVKEDSFKLHLYDVLLEQVSEPEKERKNFADYLRILDQEIQKLPEKQKEIFLLHKKEGLTVKEVASFLCISPKTVENQYTAAVRTIRGAFYARNIRTLELFCAISPGKLKNNRIQKILLSIQYGYMYIFHKLQRQIPDMVEE